MLRIRPCSLVNRSFFFPFVLGGLSAAQLALQVLVGPKAQHLPAVSKDDGGNCHLATRLLLHVGRDPAVRLFRDDANSLPTPTL